MTLVKFAPLAMAGLMLAACGTTTSERAATGALGGAAAGALIGGGATAAVVGGVVGAGIGAATTPEHHDDAYCRDHPCQ